MYIRVLVKPGAKRDLVNQRSVDRFRLDVKAPAKSGAANERTRELLASHLKIPKEQIRLIGGHNSVNKLFSIRANLQK